MRLRAVMILKGIEIAVELQMKIEEFVQCISFLFDFKPIIQVVCTENSVVAAAVTSTAAHTPIKFFGFPAISISFSGCWLLLPLQSPIVSVIE